MGNNHFEKRQSYRRLLHLEERVKEIKKQSEETTQNCKLCLSMIQGAKEEENRQTRKDDSKK